MNLIYRNLSFVFVAISVLTSTLFTSVIGGSSNKGKVDSGLSCYENKNTIERKCIIANQKMVDSYKDVTYVKQDDTQLCKNGKVGIQMYCNICKVEYDENIEILCETPVCLCRKNPETKLYEVHEVTGGYAAQQVSCNNSLAAEKKRNPNYHTRLPLKVCRKAIKNNKHTGNHWYRVNKACKNLK